MIDVEISGHDVVALGDVVRIFQGPAGRNAKTRPPEQYVIQINQCDGAVEVRHFACQKRMPPEPNRRGTADERERSKGN